MKAFRFRFYGIVCLIVLSLLAGNASLAQKDPGVRPGKPGAGTMLPGLSPIEQSMFSEGLSAPCSWKECATTAAT